MKPRESAPGNPTIRICRSGSHRSARYGHLLAALNDATVENGCLWMLPGTHRFGIIPKEKWANYERMSLGRQAAGRTGHRVEGGSCSFHHGLILHSSRPNQTNQRRRGYATHYVSARCRYTGPDGQNDAMLVRGASIPGCI